MKQIIHGVDALARQNFRELGANPFHKLHSGGGFQHLKGW